MPKEKKQRKRPKFHRVTEGVFQNESSGAYYARFSFKGKRIYKALGTRGRPCTSLVEAKRLLRDRRDEAEQTDTKISSLSVHQLVERYRLTLHGAESTKAYKDAHLDLLKNSFPATKKVREVNTHDLRLFLKQHECKSAATVNKAITVLRDVFEADQKIILAQGGACYSRANPLGNARIPFVNGTTSIKSPPSGDSCQCPKFIVLCANGIIPCAVQYGRRDVIAANKTIESVVVEQNGIKF